MGKASMGMYRGWEGRGQEGGAMQWELKEVGGVMCLCTIWQGAGQMVAKEAGGQMVLGQVVRHLHCWLWLVRMHVLQHSGQH
jgi:hypothetical protein